MCCRTRGSAYPNVPLVARAFVELNVSCVVVAGTQGYSNELACRLTQVESLPDTYLVQGRYPQ